MKKAKAVVLILLIFGEIAFAADPFPVTLTDDLKNSVTITKKPKRIISLAPNVTETLFALGLEKKVVAVTTYCDYPPKAKRKDKIGGYTNPDLEKIVSLKPDLVIASRGSPMPVLRKLRELKVPLFAIDPKSVKGVLNSIEKIGKITGSRQRTRELLEKLSKRIKTVTDKTRKMPPEHRPRVYLELWDKPLTAIGANNFINDLVSLAGGKNIFAGALSEYPEVSAEEIIAHDPQVIILAGMLKEAKVKIKEVKNRPGWRNISAVKNNRIFYINPDILNRPGPRVVEALEELAKAFHPEIFGRKGA